MQPVILGVISMANLRHNHKAMNKINIIQVANLHCWSGEQIKIGVPNIYPKTPEIQAERVVMSH